MPEAALRTGGAGWARWKHTLATSPLREMPVLPYAEQRAADPDANAHGTCPECGGRYTLHEDNTVRRHRRRHMPCPGSGQETANLVRGDVAP